MDWKALNSAVIAEFRDNGGKVAQFGDLPVVILHTIGAKTGRLLEVPLITVIENDGTMLLFGSNAGSDKHPVWLYNVRSHPRIKVELGAETFTAEIVELGEEERLRRIAIQSERTPQFADYVASAAPRQIPVFEIRRLAQAVW